jgi:hypothetical protein
MGSCVTHHHEDKVIHNKSIQDVDKIISRLKDQLDEKYRDMPEVEGKIITNI